MLHKTGKSPLFFVLAFTLFLLSACGGAPSGGGKPSPTPIPIPTPAPTPAPAARGGSLSVAEFDALLAAQPLAVVNAAILYDVSTNIGGVAELIVCEVKNNSDAEIRDITLGYVAWDKDNLPLKGHFGMANTYYAIVDLENINLLPGGVFEANGQNLGTYARFETGWAVMTFAEPVTFKIIAISYTDYDGNTWHNPYAAAFNKAYSGAKYSEDRILEIVPAE
jgi:hypothetical protein